MHDRIINGEKIHDVYPQKIIEWLHTSGYATKFWKLPKLWYPHFLIIAVLKD
jgi:hypothetical protein